MRRIFFFLSTFLMISCGRNVVKLDNSIITVSIAPFKYFVEEIGGNDFTVNVMVPEGADPHVYEPFPEQINKLRESAAYISNGFLGFEMNWLERFYETNPAMKRLSLGDSITPIAPDHQHVGGHIEGADPHYWESPKCALVIARSVRVLLCELKPSQKLKYDSNYNVLVSKIQDIDKKAREYFSDTRARSFMIYHPNLAYLAKDYELEEIPMEYEGKEPTPSRLRDLIDLSRKDHIKTIFVQREYDSKNARVIGEEIDAQIAIIDPLAENWAKSIDEIIEELHKSLIESSK